MPKRDKTTKVLPVHGHIFTYDVESWTHPGMPHRVDLLEHQGNGACSCTSFRIDKATNLKTGSPPQTSETRCRHIRACCEYQMNQILKEVALLERHEAQMT